MKGRQEEFWLEQTFAGYPEYLGRCSDRAEQASELTLSAAADFAAPPGRAGNCCFSVADLDTSTRTQNGHIRNDTRDVSRRTTFA